MTIGNTDYEEGGVATCAKQRKIADIHNRKPAGRLHAEKKLQDCGAQPPPGEFWSGLNPTMLSTDNTVTGAITNMLRKENHKKRHSCQEDQGPQSYWSTHNGNFLLPADLPSPRKNRNNMCLSGLAVHHPAYETLLEYVTGGCLVKTGRNWTKEEIHKEVMRGPHESDLAK